MLGIFSVQAQNWTGAVDANWNNPANWSATPTSNSSKVINPNFYTGNAFSPVISVASTFNSSTVTVVNGGQLTIQQNLTTTDNVTVSGVGSSITVTNGLFGVNPTDDGRLIVDLGATMLVSGGTVLVGQRFISGEDAVVTISGGTVTSNERLLMDMGGTFLQNGGTVNVLETLALADGGATNSCYYKLSGGNLNVTGEFAFENEAGNFTPTFKMTGGNLTVNGEVFWFGEAPGIGTPKMILSGGTATINGAITNLAGSTVNMYLKIDSLATVYVNGPSITTIQASDSILLSGTGNLIISGATTYTNAGVFHATGGVLSFDAATQLVGNGVQQWHTTTIQNLKTVTSQLINPIKISGNTTVFGTLNALTTPIHFNGNLAQTWGGSTEVTLGTVQLNHTGTGVELLKRLQVSNQLILNQGVLHTSAANPIVVNAGATATEGNATSFIDGVCIKKGNTAFVFPLGNESRWARMEMSAPVSAATEIHARYLNASFSSTNPVDAPLTAVSSLEHWNVDRVGSSDQVALTFYWEDAQLSAISDCSALAIARWDGDSWNATLGQTTGSCTNNGSGKILGNSAFANLGAFTFGFMNDVTNQSITLCDGETFTIGNSNYTNSGVYIDVLTNQLGEDSTVITTLTILDPIVEQVSFSACHGDTLFIDGEPYVSSTNFSNTYFSSVGCDSVVNYQLVFSTPINAAVTVSGITIQAVNLDADAYLWRNCETNEISANETEASFTPTVNGVYQVLLTVGECDAWSECISITSVGLDQLENQSFYSFPNPADEKLVVRSSGSIIERVIIYDQLGNVLKEIDNLSVLSIDLDVSEFARGMYWLQINETGQHVKWIKR